MHAQPFLFQKGKNIIDVLPTYLKVLIENRLIYILLVKFVIITSRYRLAVTHTFLNRSVS